MMGTPRTKVIKVPLKKNNSFNYTMMASFLTVIRSRRVLGFRCAMERTWNRVRTQIQVENILDFKYVLESEYNIFFWHNFMLNKA